MCIRGKCLLLSKFHRKVFPLHPAAVVSSVHQRRTWGGASGPRRVLERENSPQKLHHEWPIRASAAEEEEHAVGSAAEQEERQTSEQSGAHFAAETQPVPALWEAGAVRAGQEPDEASGPPDCGIRWARLFKECKLQTIFIVWNTWIQLLTIICVYLSSIQLRWSFPLKNYQCNCQCLLQIGGVVQ